MKPEIEFQECLIDSPKFRASLEETENGIDVLEVKLEKLVKLCSSMIDAGKTYNVANRSFINGVHDVAVHFKDDGLVTADTEVSNALKKFTNVLNEINNYHSILLDQAQRSVCTSLNSFIKNEISKVKDTRKHFEKISSDLDQALSKNAQVPKSRPQECEDAHNVLTAMRSCFGHTSLDYVFQINILHSRKRFDILDTLLAYMNAQNTFFHQGSDMFEDLEPFMKEVANQLGDLSAKADKERKEMEERHVLVQRQKELEQTCSGLPTRKGSASDAQVRMEGYLFKRTTNAFKSWVRRWFVIQKNQLVYRKRSKDVLTIMEDDLRLCKAKKLHDIDRRFCFELISPKGTHILQADSEGSCHAWMSAIHEGMSKAYTHRQSSPEEQGNVEYEEKETEESNDAPTGSNDQAAVNNQAPVLKAVKSADRPMSQAQRTKQILSVAGNTMCADCGLENPRWASINLGITLCIACSGIHRSFGVQVSKVRSLTLDELDPEHMRILCSVGNTAANRIYEASVDESVTRPGPHCASSQREQWIKSKYVEKVFVEKLKPEDGAEAKRWSVRKKHKSKSKQTPDKTEPLETVSEDLSTGTAGSKDSGLSGSDQEVVVFGNPTISPEIPESEDSGSETEGDSGSTTSWEDMSLLSPDMLLYKAAQAKNMSVMLHALALGANPNWHNSDEEGRTPSIQSIQSGSMTVLEFLLLNGAKADIKDDRGQSPLHHAAIHGHIGQICQLLKRSANQNAYDDQHRTPLSIAVENANADIVTILRLSKLNEEMRETEGFHAGHDETFSEVFKDFTNMANNQPEKLNRNKTE